MAERTPRLSLQRTSVSDERRQSEWMDFRQIVDSTFLAETVVSGKLTRLFLSQKIEMLHSRQISRLTVEGKANGNRLFLN